MRPRTPDSFVPPIYPELQALSSSGTAISSGGLTTANLAYYVPIFFLYPAQIYSLSFAASNGTGNYDLGLYDGYSKNRIQSTGSTAMTAAGVKTMTLTTDYRVDAGKLYYAALALSSTSGTVWRWVPASVTSLIGGGFGQQASALPLPSTMTPVTATATVIPLFVFGVR